MHPDRKIGFAMGILLVGIVGALFFRNEPLLTDRTPTVRREQDLNRELKARDVAVYLDEGPSPNDPNPRAGQHSLRWTMPEFVEDLTKQNSGVPLPIAAGGSFEPLDGRSAAPENRIHAMRVIPDDGEQSGESSASTTASAITNRETDRAVQLSQPSDASRQAPRPLPPLFADNGLKAPATPTSPEAKPAESEGPQLLEVAQYDEYTVKYGDTLSGIAERVLGSQSKYQELFEANRDRITAPDRLQVGKVIRIPRQIH